MSKKTDHLMLTCLLEIGMQWKRQELLIGKIMTQINELAAKLDAINTQMAKAVGEVQGRLATLQATLENAALPPEAEAALGNLVAAVQAFDDLTPDAPTPEPEPATEQTPEEPPVA